MLFEPGEFQVYINSEGSVEVRFAHMLVRMSLDAANDFICDLVRYSGKSHGK